MKKKTLKKLKRAELVDMIYELRKDNLALEERCESLKERLEDNKRIQRAFEAAPSSDALNQIRGMLKALCSAMNVPEAIEKPAEDESKSE